MTDIPSVVKNNPIKRETMIACYKYDVQMFSLKAKKKDITFSYRTKRNKANIQVRIMAYRIKKIRLMTVFGRNPHEEQITL